MMIKLGTKILLPLVIGSVLSLSYLSGILQQTSAAESINLRLVVDTTKLIFQDLNNNTKPDAGEFSSVVGTLFTPGTQNEVGKYRCFFSWGGWSNSTEGIPVTPALQVFDIKGNGTIVVVGDEPSVGAEEKEVLGAIAGGTGNYTGISGVAGLTAKQMEDTDFPVDVAIQIQS